ncbi:MAG TPA: divergent PAP2 family protein [Anaerolineales bacterium]|nr:divergent PAP2 family protein [Anaerolineales bacterium]
MIPSGLLHNHVLIAALFAWGTAQTIKLPIEYFRSRQWRWTPLFTVGGMPSSHSALIVGATNAAGLYYGYDSPVFALGVAISMIVTYDAAGVRRQAGKHAERINFLFDELLQGRIWDEDELREVLGHTPLEVIGGILWGLLLTTLVWFFWK